MKLHIQHTEKTYLVSKMNITRLNSTTDKLLVRLCKMFVRIYMDYAYTALTTLKKSQKHRLQVIQNRCLPYAIRTVDFTCISNDELRSHCKKLETITMTL